MADIALQDFEENPELRKHYYYKIYDLLCKHCNICHSGGHDPIKIEHKASCPLYQPTLVSATRITS